MRRPSLYYVNLGLPPRDGNTFEAALKELPGVLQQAPLEAEITVQRLAGKAMEQVTSILNTTNHPLHEVNVALYQALHRQGFKDALFAVGCPRIHPVLWAVATNGIWGTSFQGGPLAVCWEVPDKFIVWHEVLHLLGADDCYDESTHARTCELANCIMQFEPTSASVGGWPFLCKRVLGRLRRCLQVQ